jgi:Flp pilus assembly protein TadG
VTRRAKKFRGFRADQRGAIAIEFALLFPILIGIFMFIIDFSEVILRQRALTQAAESIVRAASLYIDPSTASAPATMSAQEQALLREILREMAPWADASNTAGGLVRLVRRADNQKVVRTGDIALTQRRRNIVVPDTELSLQLRPGDHLLVAEIAYTHDHMFSLLGLKSTIVARHSR